MKTARIVARRFVMQEGSLSGEVSLMVPTNDQRTHTRTAYGDVLELSNLYVDPRRRGRGWAAILMQAACSHADREGINLILSVRPYGKKPGVPAELLSKWYERFGFEEYGGVMVRKCVASLH